MNAKILSIMSIALVVCASLCCFVPSDESDAAYTGNNEFTLLRGQLCSGTLDQGYATSGSNYRVITEILSGSIPGVTFKLEDYYTSGYNVHKVTYSGVPTEVGVYTIFLGWSLYVGQGTSEYTITVREPFHTVSFDANGGNCDLISKEVYYGSSFSLPSCVKDYSVFSGWFTERSGGVYVGGPGDTYTPDSDVTLYAHYDSVAPKIVSEIGETYCVQGSSFSYYVVVTPLDCVITVSGADWLSVSGNVVSGTPDGDTKEGTYHITITASYGNESAMQFFDIVVVKKLDFETIPTGGIIVRPVIE